MGQGWDMIWGGVGQVTGAIAQTMEGKYWVVYQCRVERGTGQTRNIPCKVRGGGVIRAFR